MGYCLLAAFAAWFMFCAGPVWADADMDMYKSKMKQAFTLAYHVGIGLAALYYISAVIRYVTEDSADSARKHLIGAGMGLFIAVSSLPIINSVLSNIFGAKGLDSINTAMADNPVNYAFHIIVRVFCFALYCGMFIDLVYIVVAALKYSFSNDSGDNAKSHLIRCLFGLFLMTTAVSVINFIMGNFGKIAWDLA